VIFLKNAAIARNLFVKKSIVNVSTQVFHVQIHANVLGVTTNNLSLKVKSGREDLM
jgi:hypothetical protein